MNMIILVYHIILLFISDLNGIEHNIMKLIINFIIVYISLKNDYLYI